MPIQFLSLGELQLVIAALLSFFATVLLWRATVRLGKLEIRPRIIVTGSSRDERERIADQLHGITKSQVDLPGLHLENIGRGLAINGDLYLLSERGQWVPIKEEHEAHTFTRIPSGWRYLYSSADSPCLETWMRHHHPKIRIKLTYYDIEDNEYHMREEEQEIDLVGGWRVREPPT